VVKPNGETTSARITLSVYYRIWVDTSALKADRSALDVVVTALPGTRVTLEGEELQLDKEGRATRSFPVDVVREAKSGQIDHVVHYRVQPPAGETVVEELHTKLGVAMMQIDRPGPELTTDRDAVEIVGAVGRDTQVSVDGVNVPVKEQRFVYKLALPKPGDYEPRVVASVAGKAPLGVTLKIKRVQSLSEAAREFEVDKALNYAKLAPNPGVYKGQSIALEGRVYAYDARNGSSVIQMLVRPCPSSQRCSLWVVDPQATEVALDKWIRVLGVVDGEQQFRSEKNQIVTVPKVVARFLLPAKP
jgi:LysM repeat protein